MSAPDLAEFVSDYLELEGASADSDRDIALAYLDQHLPAGASLPEELERLAPQIGYYR